ncbi:g11234 [Coccomyxa viridis]|uniref:G11234 protein n=1 Tax=Coccomyxa viridis TaxID=1274662 RepID=A0ABP1G7N0_9CHLO
MRSLIMLGTVLMLVCGAVLTSGLPQIEAEQRMGESLGRSGGPTQHRALLMTPMVYTTPYWSDELDLRITPEKRGQGATYQPDSDYFPSSYHGPTVGSGSGGLAVANRLTMLYPRDGVSCTIPGTSASQKTYDAQRPWYHTFPKGYTLQFVPFYAAEYMGHHWAVYDQTKRFYSFDDGDNTSGDYDYDDSDEPPAGCHYLDEQPSDAAGNETGHMTNYSAPAPAPQTASGNATVASATHLALRGSSSTKRPGPVMMLCTPIPAAGDRLDKNFVICITVIPGSIILIYIFARVAYCCNKRRRVHS